VNLADAIGYCGSVGTLLFKDLVARDTSRLRFFTAFSYALSVLGSVGLMLAATYFWRQAARAAGAASRGA
jgi:hypothetical protein